MIAAASCWSENLWFFKLTKALNRPWGTEGELPVERTRGEKGLMAESNSVTSPLSIVPLVKCGFQSLNFKCVCVLCLQTSGPWLRAEACVFQSIIKSKRLFIREYQRFGRFLSLNFLM